MRPQSKWLEPDPTFTYPKPYFFGRSFFWTRIWNLEGPREKVGFGRLRYASSYYTMMVRHAQHLQRNTLQLLKSQSPSEPYAHEPKASRLQPNPLSLSLVFLRTFTCFDPAYNDVFTHRPQSSSFLWLIFRILQGHPEKELLWSLRVSSSPKL